MILCLSLLLHSHILQCTYVKQIYNLCLTVSNWLVNILLLVKQVVFRRCFPNGLTSVDTYKEVISRVPLLHGDLNDQHC
jgi:hypothetical protein